MHSLAGVLAHDLGRLLGPRLKACVYVAAVVPGEGRSFAQAIGFPGRLLLPLLFRFSPEGLRPSEKMIRAELCGDLTPEDASLVVQRYHAEYPGLYLSVVGAPPTCPSSYVRLTRDRSVPPQLQVRMAARLSHASGHEIDAGHLVMLSRPHRTPHRSPWMHVTGAALLVLLGTLACSTEAPTIDGSFVALTVSGTVRTAQGNAVNGASLAIYARDPRSCTGTFADASTTTDASGVFTQTVANWNVPRDVCVWIAVAPPPGAGVVGDTVTVRPARLDYVAPSLTVHVVLASSAQPSAAHGNAETRIP